MVLCIVSYVALQGAITVQSRFEPSVLGLGEEGTFVIVVDGTQRQARVSLPNIDGLKMAYKMGMVSSDMINGVVKQNVTYTFSVFGTKVGLIQFPEFSLEVNGQSYVVPAASLTILQGDKKKSAERALYYLGLTLPNKSHYFVGEAIPFSVYLNIVPHLRGTLNHFPVKKGDSFATKDIAREPTKGAVNVRGIQYGQFLWKDILTPVKAGKYPLSYSLDLTLELPRNQEDEEDDNGFSPLINVLRTEHRQVLVQSREAHLNVLSLPLEGRPTSFTGGIGKWQVVQTMIREKEAIQDEPLTFLVRLEGKGNFESLQPPELLAASTDWRQYAPKKVFHPDDDVGFNGKLDLEYTIVPLKSGIMKAPEAIIHVFNPETEQYESISGRLASDVTVKPPLHAVPHAVKHVDVVTSTGAEQELIPIFIQQTRLYATNCPAIFRQKFWYAQAAIACLLGLFGLVFRRRYRLNTDAGYRQLLETEKQVQTSLLKAQEAARKGDAQQFYAHAQEAIQRATQGKIPSGGGVAMAAGDVEQLLRDRDRDHLGESIIADVHRLLEAADAIRFSGSGRQVGGKAILLAEYERLRVVVTRISKDVL